MRLAALFVVVLASAIGTWGQPPSKEPTNMARIPGATYFMGLDGKEIPSLMAKFKVGRPDPFADEVPGQIVTIAPFYLDKTEVTNAEFRRFVDVASEWQKNKIPAENHNGKYLLHWNGNDFPAGQGRYPVVFVTWYSAVAYCQFHGKRLPTEAEWEYAARGGLKGKEFPWGDEMPDKSRANYSASGLNAATSVASYPSNGYGLFDVAGNVWEYLADEWQKYPYSNSSPAIVKDRSYMNIKTRRALRGGSYGGAIINLRNTYRDSHLPGNAGDHVGFRCAK